MKKKMIAAGSVLVLGAVILPAGIHALAANLTDERAKEIALKDAGVSENEVAYSSVELDFEDGRQVYEVEFYTKDFKEYDYEIDPADGTILSVDYDAEDYLITRSQDGNVSASVSPKKAKKLALKHAGFSDADVTFVKAELDYDDGRLSYEIEFVTKGYEEYDYEIDAGSGEILSWDFDAENYYNTGRQDSGRQESERYDSERHDFAKQKEQSASITLEDAKAAALKKAGLKSSQVTFTKAKQDFDDGRMTYEVEFWSGGMEYEAEIDAQTGNILDWECERD